jgi:hypothetical protein
MITITNTHKHGIQLNNDQGPDGSETLTLGTLDALVSLQEQIEVYLQKRGKTEYITTYYACRLAKAEGYVLKATTLNSACTRGTIPQAKKLYGRWQMPKPSFETWYTAWKSKKEKSQ